jgi:hypothetical protein
MLTSLTQIQISGLVALSVSTPFLIKSVRNLYLTNASKQWPKVSGTIKEISGLGIKYSVLYEYTVNRATYNSHKISFTTSNTVKNQSVKEFEKRYVLNQIVDVFYNQNNPKTAVLEPGRKEGLLLAIIILSVLFAGGCMAFFH